MEYNLWLINTNINYSIVEWHSYPVSWTFLGCSFNYTRNPIFLQYSPTQTITRHSRWGLRVISAASVVTFLSLWLRVPVKQHSMAVIIHWTFPDYLWFFEVTFSYVYFFHTEYLLGYVIAVLSFHIASPTLQVF